MKNLLMRLTAVLFIWAANGFCSTEWPNEPAGSVNMFDCGFENPTCDGRLWDLWKSAAVTTQADAPFSPTSTHIWRLPANSATGGGNLIWPNISRKEDQKPLKELYIGLWWKMSASYQGSMNNANKIMYIKSFNYPFGSHSVNSFLYARGAQGGPSFEITWAHNTTGLDNSHVCAYDKGLTCFNNAGSVPILRNKWYQIEVYIKASTTTTSRDGTMRWWVNNTLCGNYTNLNIGSGIINEVNFDPVWDGTFICSSRDCSLEWAQYYDHARISAPNGAVTPFLISTGTILPPAIAGKPYSVTLQASGGQAPYGWTVTSGSLLPGLTLNKTTGVIAGVPTASGRCDFTAKVSDAKVPPAEVTKTFSIIASGTSIVGNMNQIGYDKFALSAKGAADRVDFDLQFPSAGKYAIKVFDLQGRSVWNYSSTTQEGSPAGSAVWNHGGNLKKGVYLVRAEQNGRSLTTNFCAIR